MDTNTKTVQQTFQAFLTHDTYYRHSASIGLRNFFGIRRLYDLICVFIVALFATTPVSALEYQAHSNIYTTVESFLKQYHAGEDAQIQISRLDNRLRLHACQQPLQAFWPAKPQNRGHSLVGIGCQDEKSWKIYVSAQVKLYKQMLVTKRPLAKGMVLQAQDLRLERREVPESSMIYLASLEPYAGYVLQRSLNSGDILYLKYLAAPQLIRRGQQVTLLAKSQGIEVRTKGLALVDGAAGERVKIRNLNSQKIIEAKVLAPGLAEVIM